MEEAQGAEKGGKKGEKGGKAKGRGRLVQRYMQPVEGGSFRYAPASQRDGLGSLQLAEYPFEVQVKTLKAEHLVEAGVSDQMMMNQKKRNNDDAADSSSRAKRTPTPERHLRQQQAYAAPAEHPPQDPWAEARHRQNAPTPPLQPGAPSSSAAGSGSELAFGSRISA